MHIGRLLNILRMRTESLYWVLTEELKALGMKPEFDYDNWIYVDNSSPIMLVAHIDTVSRNQKLKFRVKKDKIKARNSVLGADDRAGVYAIMEILNICKSKNIPMPSILFTNYEECGLIGVDDFIKAKKMEKNMNIFIEIDRKGENEFVFYSDTLPKEVEEWVTSFGFVEQWGSMSDVMSLTNEYKVPHVNVSVGYYEQHSKDEYLIISELETNINRVMEMILNPITELYEVEPSRFGSMMGYGFNRGFNTNDYYNRNACEYGYGYENSFDRMSPIDSPDCIYLDKFQPKVFSYVMEIDELMELDYEPENADIPWEEDPLVFDEYFETYGWDGYER